MAFNIKSVTLKEYELWLTNKNINPRTKKKISNNGKIFKYLESIDIKELYFNECINDIDPISLNNLWIVKDNKKTMVPKNLDNIVFYKDQNDNIKFFEKDTIAYMKEYNINYDPLTRVILPTTIFENIEGLKIIEENDKSIEEIALDVFQLFNNNSIFIDHNLFLELDKNNLLKFNYEVSDFYKHNFNDTQKNETGNTILLLNNYQLESKTIDEIKKYLLNEIKTLLKCEIEEYKYMINYIIVAALSLVIPLVKELYPHYSFNF